MPPGEDATFVARMEDVLDVSARPPELGRPLVCFDESGKDLKADVRSALPVAPGQPAREDAESARHGSANCLLAVAPHLGWRHVAVTERRAAVDWAPAMRELVDVHFPDAERIVLVLDNLNTHDPGSLSKAFPPAEAKRIWDKLEFHFTPKHGSWLNIAELELSVLARQCLARRIPDRATLAAEVAAWSSERNAARVGVAWRFTTADARARLPQRDPLLPPHR